MLPLRDRVVPLLCVFLGAPLAAEYLQAYLPFTGDPWASLIGVAVFAPLYGGAALLIRELAVRGGRGWAGALLARGAVGGARALLCVFLGAPLAAEYLQAYLPFTGDPWASLIGVAFFAPLYGGAALLIRELAVRCGLGWTGTLLLAAAFGLAMPGLVDLAMFGED